MESNKDESEKCIKIAVDCIKSGDNEKALRFLHKAQRLYSTPRAEVLIDKLTSNLNGAAASGSSTPNGDSPSEFVNGSASGSHNQHLPEDGEHVRHRTKSGSKSSADAEKSYTKEQLEAVKSVKKCKDYYEILGVSKDCSEDDLKKSYRKMALKLHPDKNHAPGATEAFKAVSNAFAVLSNPEKRQKYDRYGADEDQVSSRRSQADFTRGFEADVTAEELFNMFFGGGFPSSHVRQRTFYTRGRSHHTHGYATADANENNYTFLLQLSPIIFMVLLSILSALFTSDPLFNLERTQKYVIERKTQQLKVPFYVKQDFNSEFKGNLHKLEQEVEEEYVSILKNNCFRERSHKENLMWRARSFGDSALYQRASELKTPSCDRIQSLYGG